MESLNSNRRARGKTYPAPLLPTASVASIKRSLMHAPRLRRFRKVQLRRHIGDVSGGGGEGDGDEQLDELDLAILDLGRVGGNEGVGGRPPLHSPSPMSSFGDPVGGLHSQEEVVVTKQRRAGRVGRRTKKKAVGSTAKVRKRRKTQPRRLPVDELTLVSERVDGLSLQDDSTDDGELSDDPIANSSSDDMNPRRRKATLKPRSRTHRPAGFDDIDISQFRLPKRRSLSPTSRTILQQSPSYSDGFEGDEACPIGRPMPISQRSCSQVRTQRVMIPMGELTLVASKHCTEARERMPRESSFQGIPAVTEIHGDGEVELDATCMHSTPSKEHYVEFSGLSKPSVDHEALGFLEGSDSRPRIPMMSSPLAHKQPLGRRVTFREDVDVHQPVIDTRRVEGRNSQRRLEHTQGVNLQTPTKPVARIRIPTRRNSELEALQQLSMVSIRKRFDSSDSESSEDEVYSDEDDSDEDLSHDEAEQSTSALDVVDSADEERGKLQDAIKLEFESGQESQSDLADESDGISSLGHEDCGSPVAIRQDSRNIQRRQSRDNIHALDKNSRKPSLQASEEIPKTSVLEEPAHSILPDNQERQHNQQGADIWRPRRPKTSNIVMEVDDEIIDSSTTPHLTTRTPRNYSRRFSSTTLTICSSRPATPEPEPPVLYDMQASIELGDTQRFLSSSPSPSSAETRHASQASVELGDTQRFVSQSPDLCIPETQPQTETEAEPQPQVAVLVRGDSYFTRATWELGMDRMASLPRERTGTLSTGLGIQRGEQSLKVLTRRASVGLGTLPWGGRRLVSLPFRPPFRR